jgi:hypothetical protein
VQDGSSHKKKEKKKKKMKPGKFAKKYVDARAEYHELAAALERLKVTHQLLE